MTTTTVAPHSPGISTKSPTVNQSGSRMRKSTPSGFDDARSDERSGRQRGADGDGPRGAGCDHAEDSDAEPCETTDDRRHDQQEYRRVRDRPDLETEVGLQAADAFVGGQKDDAHGDPAPDPSPHQAGGGSGGASDHTRGAERVEHTVVAWCRRRSGDRRRIRWGNRFRHWAVFAVGGESGRGLPAGWLLATRSPPRRTRCGHVVAAWFPQRSFHG